MEWLGPASSIRNPQSIEMRCGRNESADEGEGYCDVDEGFDQYCGGDALELWQ